MLVVEDDDRVDHLEHPGALPVRQIPAHRNRNSADLPASKRGQNQMLAVRNSKRHKRTDLRASRGQCAAPLIGASIEFSEGQAVCAAVGRQRDHSSLVAELLRELLKPGPERYSAVCLTGATPAAMGPTLMPWSPIG